jgi:hypothetical protein
MQRTGGILAIVGGVLGLLAAVVTVFLRDYSAEIDPANAGASVTLGWISLVLTVVTIVLGVLALRRKEQIYGILVVVSALLAAILGRGFVAVGVAVAIIGGILVVVAAQQSAKG